MPAADPHSELVALVSKVVPLTEVLAGVFDGDCPFCKGVQSFGVANGEYSCAICSAKGDVHAWRKDVRVQALMRKLPVQETPAEESEEGDGYSGFDMPLFSEEAEMAALGSMIMSDKAAAEVAAYLSASDFYRPAHKVIFKALATMVANNVGMDLVNLRNQLVSAGDLLTAGGEDYLIFLGEYVPSVANAMNYAHTVKDKSSRRTVIREARKLIDLAGKDVPPSEILIKKQALADLPMNGYMSRKVLETHGFDKTFSGVSLTHLIKPYLPKGKAILLDADGGTGKSSFLIALAAALSRGFDPITGQQVEPVRTLYLHKGEDQSEELQTVYIANDGDPSMIRYVTDDSLVFDAKGIERIGNTIVDGKYELLGVDAFFYFLQGIVRDTNANMPALQVMQPFNAMLAATQATAVDVRHTTKGRLEREASDLGMGTVQFRNSHRGQLVMRWDPKDQEENKRVIVTDEKGSLLNPRGKPFAFRRVGMEIQFSRDEVENPFISPEADLYERRDRKTKEGGGRGAGKIAQIEQWIRETLSGCCYEMEKLRARAHEKGFKDSTYYLALKNVKEEIEQKKNPSTGSMWAAIKGFGWPPLETLGAEGKDQENADPFAD